MIGVLMYLFVADKDPARVAAGLKATLHNQNVSPEAKQHAQERLESMGAIGTQHHLRNKAQEPSDPQQGSESHIIGIFPSRLPRRIVFDDVT
jgi:Conidiation protein 6